MKSIAIGIVIWGGSLFLLGLFARLMWLIFMLGWGVL